MDKISDNIIRLINNYLSELEKNSIPIRRAVIFGSHAAGNANEWSDIDIALVSDVFEGSRLNDRKKIRKVTLAMSSDISPIPFRTEDFTEEDPFVREILETGIKIV